MFLALQAVSRMTVALKSVSVKPFNVTGLKGFTLKLVTSWTNQPTITQLVVS